MSNHTRCVVISSSKLSDTGVASFAAVLGIEVHSFTIEDSPKDVMRNGFLIGPKNDLSANKLIISNAIDPATLSKYKRLSTEGDLGERGVTIQTVVDVDPNTLEGDDIRALFNGTYVIPEPEPEDSIDDLLSLLDEDDDISDILNAPTTEPEIKQTEPPPTEFPVKPFEEVVQISDLSSPIEEDFNAPPMQMSPPPIINLPVQNTEPEPPKISPFPEPVVQPEPVPQFTQVEAPPIRFPEPIVNVPQQTPIPEPPAVEFPKPQVEMPPLPNGNIMPPLPGPVLDRRKSGTEVPPLPGASGILPPPPLPNDFRRTVGMGDDQLTPSSSGTHGTDGQHMNVDPESAYANNGLNFPTPMPTVENFREALSPSERAEQARMEYNRSTLGTVPSHLDIRNSGNLTSKIINVTGSHGGAGKTTTAWVLANVLALSFRELGIKTPVFLIEADYRNPKFAARMSSDSRVRIPTLGDASRSITQLSDQNRLNGDVVVDIIQQVSTQQQDSGLNVLPCPHDLDNYDPEPLKFAIMSAARVVVSPRFQGIAFIDSGTMTSGKFEQLDETLGLRMANMMVLVTEPDDYHTVDAERTFHIATQGGRMSPANVHGFLNKSKNIDQVRDYQTTSKFQISGYFPKINELEGGWVGNASSTSINAMTIRAGHALINMGFTELRELFDAQEVTKRGKRRGLRLFGRR